MKKILSDNAHSRLRHMKHKHLKQAPVRKQQGAVMAVVLMLLVVITLMGTTSLKNGMYQGQLGASEVAYNVCFQAAESGLNAVYREYQEQVIAGIPMGKNENYMNKAANNDIQYRCLSKDGLVELTGTSCSSNMSQYANVQVLLTSREPGDNELAAEIGFGTDNKIGGSTLIYTDSECQLSGMGLRVTNTQAWSYKINDGKKKATNTGS